MRLLGLGGAEGSGKDSSADILVKRGWVKLGFADALRELALELNPILEGEGTVRLSDAQRETFYNNTDILRMIDVLTRRGSSILRKCISESQAWQILFAIDPLIHTEDKGLRYADALAIHGYHDAKWKYPEARNFLQKLGTEGVRNVLGDDTWIAEAMRRAADKMSKGCAGVVFADTRFPNEVAAIQDFGKVVYVERPGYGSVNGHASSNHKLIEENADYRIVNDGSLEWLAHQLETIEEALDWN